MIGGAGRRPEPVTRRFEHGAGRAWIPARWQGRQRIFGQRLGAIQPEGGGIKARLVLLNREGEQGLRQGQEFFRAEARQRGREVG